MVHNKLVRDNIPNIIKESGHECKYRILNDKEFLEELKRKLVEESIEYCNSGDIEELADVFEVIGFILDCNNWTYDKVYQVAHEKAEKRGVFYKKYFLEETIGD